ncbi:hypothetical protein DYB34_009155 [Aphanomyces astaci]|uniref:Uncharacterized protein n=1 Tax=Aphanomyces astaci TaxID=112090 RepID=A0A418BJG6_APHAT|nr:hypothetical protein DYB34_009155 [Aphanomyces astaci]
MDRGKRTLSVPQSMDELKNSDSCGIATISIRVQAIQAIEVPKLKNMFQAVKSEFSTLRWSMDKETGNATEQPFDLPTYWDFLVEHFGDKTGLGHYEFGTSDPPSPAKSVDDTSTADGLKDDVTNVDDACHESNGPGKRKLELQQEMQRQRERRKKGKIDVASGLVSMGEIMAKGLVDAAALSHNGGVNDGVSKQLQVVLETISDFKTVKMRLS